MRGARFSLIAVLALLGCNSLENVKVENPVMGAPPPRVAAPDERLRGDAYVNNPIEPSVPDVDPGEVVPVDFGLKPDTQHDELSGSQVVAKVNGKPIFAVEALERYGTQLAQARAQMSPAQFRRMRESLIKRDLEAHIERKLLVESLRSTLQKEQLEALEGHLDQMFAKEIARMTQELGVNTKRELEIELNKQGTTLENLRNTFGHQQMAREYLFAKVKRQRNFGRRDLIGYYNAHSEDYAVPGRVRWQQIRIDYDKHRGKRNALRVLEKAIEELLEGADFGEVARRYSDGPLAKQSGQWDWTQAGSLNDTRIEKALFELPVGEISQVFEGEDGFHLVKVTERKPAGRVPFAEVQDEIKRKLEQQARREATRKMLDELRESAVVETIFD